MTETPEPDQNMPEAIRALRHDILAAGRHVDWEDARGRIRFLLIKARPSPDERIELLELYDQVATRVERQRAGDADLLRRLRRQRASDTMTFPFAEARNRDDISVWDIINREIAIGRLRIDPYFGEVVDQMTRVLESGAARPPGVAEEGAIFHRPDGFSRPASPTSPPSP